MFGRICLWISTDSLRLNSNVISFLEAFSELYSQHLIIIFLKYVYWVPTTCQVLWWVLDKKRRVEQIWSLRMVYCWEQKGITSSYLLNGEKGRVGILPHFWCFSPCGRSYSIVPGLLNFWIGDKELGMGILIFSSFFLVCNPLCRKHTFCLTSPKIEFDMARPHGGSRWAVGSENPMWHITDQMGKFVWFWGLVWKSLLAHSLKVTFSNISLFLNFISQLI